MRLLPYILVFVLLSTSVFAEEIDWSDDSVWDDPKNIEQDPEGAIAADAERAFALAPETVIDHVSQGRVVYSGSTDKVVFDGASLKRPDGAILDIDVLPQGASIKPSGELGFSIILKAEQGDAEVVIADKAEGLKISSEKDTITITLSGQKIYLKDGKVEISDNSIRLEKGAEAELLHDGGLVAVKALKSARVMPEDHGFLVKGKFQAHFLIEGYGKISVPSIMEAKVLEAKIDTELPGLTLQLGDFPAPDEERSATWDGDKLRIKGLLSASIVDGAEMVHAMGNVKGVLYRLEPDSMYVEKKPHVNDIRDLVIDDIEEKKEELEAKHDEIEEKLDSSLSEKDRRILEHSVDVVEERLDKLPDSDFSSDDHDNSMYNYYEKKDLDRYPVPLVTVFKVKDNHALSNAITYMPGKDEYSILSAKANLLTPSMRYVDTSPSGLDFTFYEQEPGEDLEPLYYIRDGVLYDEDKDRMMHHGDVKVTVAGNRMVVKGDMTRTLMEAARASGGFFAGLFGPGRIEAAFAGTDLDLLDVEVSEDKVSIRNDLKSELEKAKDVTLASTVKENFKKMSAKLMKDEVYIRDNIEFVTSKIDLLAENGILSRQTTENLKKVVSNSFAELRDDDRFFALQEYHGLDIDYEQTGASEGSVMLTIKGSPGEVTIGPKRIMTDNVHIPEEIRENLKKVQKPSNLVDLYQDQMKRLGLT